MFAVAQESRARARERYSFVIVREHNREGSIASRAQLRNTDADRYVIKFDGGASDGATSASGPLYLVNEPPALRRSLHARAIGFIGRRSSPTETFS